MKFIGMAEAFVAAAFEAARDAPEPIATSIRLAADEAMLALDTILSEADASLKAKLGLHETA